MNKTFDLNEEGILTVKCEYARVDYTKYIEKAQRLLAENVQIKGFRKGKAPFSEAVKYIKAEDMYDRMIKLMVKDTNKTLLSGAPEGTSISLAKQPTINVDYDKKEDKYVLTYKCISSPVVTLGNYKKLVTDVKKNTIGTKDVDEVLQRIRENQGVLEEKDGDYAAAKGDIVTIDAIGYIDNKSFEGGTLKGYDLELGSKVFVDTFEDQLVGVKVGEEKGVDIVFPENYLAELANKKAHFDVKVIAIKQKVYPEINDELAKNDTEYSAENLADLKKKIKEKLQANEEINYKNRLFDSLMKKIDEGSKVIVNQALVDYENEARYAKQLGEIKNIASSAGITIEDYCRITKTSLDDVKKSCEATSLQDIRRVAVYEKLCQEYKLNVTEEDLDNFGKGEKVYEDFIKKFKANPNDPRAQEVMTSLYRTIMNTKLVDCLLKDNPVKASKAKETKEEEKEEVKAPVKKTAEKKPATKKTTTTKKTAASTKKEA
ncbi:MAG TPA: trigger factor [Firmicutes bacterium]|nr:trigger factor [Bacillota bacterium]